MKAEFYNSIWKSESPMWSDYLPNVRGSEVWRVAKYVNPRAAAMVEFQTEREGKHVITATEKEEMLRRESFRENDNDQYYDLPLAGSA
jgi:hypothetical protein